MKNIIIIGAGELGSRHLQGALKYSEPHNVYVLDPSEAALAVARQRGEEIENSHTSHFITSSEMLPAEAELAIIATNSNVRARVAKDLLEKVKLKYLVLEKVLFQDMASYDLIADAIAKSGVKTFVNHPRRSNAAYSEIAATLQSEGTMAAFSVVGENWDMGCNALHMIDLFVFLTGSGLKSVNTEGVDNELLESKRNGYVEFTGTITGIMEAGHTFSITSFKGGRGAITTNVSNAKHRWLVQEGGTKGVYHLSLDNNFRPEQQEYFQDYQSNLTTELLKDLYNSGTCKLPGYEVAATTHKIFIGALLKKYNTITNLNALQCPIT